MRRAPLPILVLALGALLGLAGCAADGDLDEPFEPLGAFKLGHNIVIADNVQKVEPSRDVTPDEWEAAMTAAIDRRFGRYTGDQFYHIAVSVEGYSVAVTGVPLVLAPKSVLIVSASVWDDAAGRKINAEPERFTILEEYNERTMIGSGLTQTKEEQVASISASAVRQIENWMRRNEEWFAPRAGAAPAAAPALAAPTGTRATIVPAAPSAPAPAAPPS
jgi:hypothetical protein